MRIPQLLLALVIASAALLLLAAGWPTGPEAAPAPHPDHASMLRAGAPPTPAMQWLGWTFGVVQIGFFGACFALGLRRREGLGPLRGPLWVGLGVYVALWTALVVTAGTAVPDAPLIGSFPPATAWMLYGLWPFPVYFAVLYVRHFDDWFLNEDDLTRFRARLRELDRDAGSGE